MWLILEARTWPGHPRRSPVFQQLASGVEATGATVALIALPPSLLHLSMRIRGGLVAECEVARKRSKTEDLPAVHRRLLLAAQRIRLFLAELPGFHAGAVT